MFELKPDFERVLERYEAWWNCEIIDRPLVSIVFPKLEAEKTKVPPIKKYKDIRDKWMDTEYIVTRAEVSLRNSVYFADALPVVWPNLGPEIFSAFYGCEMIYGERTAWSKPILKDLSEESLSNLRLDTDGFYYKKIMEMTDAFITAGKDKFIDGYTDIHAGGDAIAALRDPQELLIDTIEHPDEIKKLVEHITSDFLKLYDVYHKKLTAVGMPSSTWLPVTCKGKLHVPSNDFSCMISTKMFMDLFLPGIIRECKHMDKCIYHLDGPQALRYLDILLEIPEIHAIQWVPGAGKERWTDWVEVYQKIQKKNKAIQMLNLNKTDLPKLFKVLKPEGVWLSNITGIKNIEEAKEVLKFITRWGK